MGTPPRKTARLGELEFISAARVLEEPSTGQRWKYECYVLTEAPTVRMVRANLQAQGKIAATASDGHAGVQQGTGENADTPVMDFMTCDKTGVLMCTVWRDDVDKVMQLMSQRSEPTTRVMLRFEQVKFDNVKNNKWNGRVLTTMRVLSSVRRSSGSQPAAAAACGRSIHDGTQISLIQEPESPYMKTAAFRAPKYPVAIAQFSNHMNGVTVPFRATLVGTVMELGDIEPTNSGGQKRSFKLVDPTGAWLHCCASDDLTESTGLKHLQKVVVFFGSGRGALGASPAAIWLFKDSFIVPLQQQIVHAPMGQQVTFSE